MAASDVPTTGLPDILKLTPHGDNGYRVTQPEESAEGRDVVFSGQLMAQMIMASDAACGAAKTVRSVHTIFARAGTYTKPIDLQIDSMQAGRTWASDTVSATQDGRLLSRSLVLLTTTDPDLMRHGPEFPSGVAEPEELPAAPRQAFPGAETRPLPEVRTEGEVPTQLVWHRYPDAIASPAANQAILAWATCGDIIALAMQPHPDRVRIQDSHRTISTGVIAHTVHFVDRFDVSEWLLVVTSGDSAAAGRVYGSGQVFARDGRLVATFHQDAMARAVEGQLDPSKAL